MHQSLVFYLETSPRQVKLVDKGTDSREEEGRECVY
jgi:hypothetical protein